MLFYHTKDRNHGIVPKLEYGCKKDRKTQAKGRPACCSQKKKKVEQ